MSAVRATSILNARKAMYALRDGPGIYGRSKDDGVSYFLSRSMQYSLARVISAVAVAASLEAHRRWMGDVFEILDVALDAKHVSTHRHLAAWPVKDGILKSVKLDYRPEACVISRCPPFK